MAAATLYNDDDAFRRPLLARPACDARWPRHPSRQYRVGHRTGRTCIASVAGRTCVAVCVFVGRLQRVTAGPVASPSVRRVPRPVLPRRRLPRVGADRRVSARARWIASAAAANGAASDDDRPQTGRRHRLSARLAVRLGPG